MVILSRRASWNERDLEIKADPRHGGDIVNGMSLIADSKGLDTPGRDMREAISDESDMNVAGAKRYSGLAAKATYIGLDRPDCQFSAREAWLSMCKPLEKYWVPVKRIARYLIHTPGLIIECSFAEYSDNVIVMHTASERGSCRTTRRSRSGGVLCVGGPRCKVVERDAWSRRSILGRNRGMHHRTGRP